LAVDFRFTHEQYCQRAEELALGEEAVEQYVFVRLHAREGEENAVEQALRDVTGPSREEQGCLSFHLFRSMRDRRLFYIHSRWRDEEAFRTHAELPHTVRFLERVDALLDQPRDVARTELIA
jgi:quinol monooxygenase YgiN